MFDENEIEALKRKSKRRKTDASIFLKNKARTFNSEMK